MGRGLVAGLLLLLAAMPAEAKDKSGAYMVGGGVGAITCPHYLDVMAQARQLGGLKTWNGADLLNPYSQYVLGFQTGYDMLVPGILDIFAKLGSDPGTAALFAIEPFCQQNPDKTFGQGVIWLAEYMREHQ